MSNTTGSNMSTQPQPQPQPQTQPQAQAQPPKKWIVKQILSGDSVLLREEPKGGPPPEKQIVFSNILAPKLARPGRGGNNAEDTKDEPFAWEAREFLRKKLIGQEVTATIDKNPSSATGSREYGFIQLGKENITHSLIMEGLVSVREAVLNSKDGGELKALDAAAKAAKKGRWDPNADPQKHIRDMKWSVENMRSFLDKHHKKRIPAIIEHVRDGSTVKALLLPDFYTITLMLTGIRCPSIKYDALGQVDPSTPDLHLAQEAKFFVEKHLLQRDVEIILESTSNNNFVGTVLLPKGNIAEGLLREGYGHCVDWSMAFLTFGADKLRAAERYAKENRIRRWKDFQPKAPTLTGKEKEFTGTVVEIINGDALMIKVGNASPRKIFLSSIRPPREQAKSEENKAGDEGGKPAAPKTKVVRPLYDIPWMFEAREFLRKKLIGKKVNVVVDYKQPAVENFPEKTCCTVTIGGLNVAEALISKGLGTVVRYRQNDDQRSSHYDELLAAEAKAQKAGKGVFAKKDIPQHRVNDLSADPTRAKQFLSSLQRSGRIDAIVEFVTSGSRLRLYIPKEGCLITFLLAGINCPRGSRPAAGQSRGNQQGQTLVPGEPYGEEALQFTKDRCMQKEVEIQVDNIDKVRGNFIGWLWIDGVNVSVALVEDGLASVHGSAEKSEHYRALKMAEDAAKARKEKIWKDFVEEVEKDERPEDEPMTERKVDYQTVVVVEATSDLRFYAQMVDQGPRLEVLMNQIRQEFQTNPPLPGAYTPKKGDLCAAKFEDDQWYRAKVEKVTNKEVQVFYIDYGNKETTSHARVASLPSNFTTEKPFAHEFALAFVKLPIDVEYQEEAVKAFKQDVEGRTLLLNVEYKIQKMAYASLTCPKTKVDIAKELISDGLLLVDSRREKRLQKVMSEYRSAQEEAKKDHRYIWQYGDVTEDDAKEFGR